MLEFDAKESIIEECQKAMILAEKLLQGRVYICQSGKRKYSEAEQ